MSSKEMDIDSDLSLASPPPEAHDGSDCPVQGLSGLSGLSADRRMEEGCATHASVHLNPEEHGRHELERGDGMELGSVQVQIR